ncbi:MAG: aspartate kinase, partial [Flavobacterium sp.]
MVVLKFGGTSVANAQNIKLAIQIIENKVKNNQLIVVVSALSGVTDMLINTSNKAASKDESYKKNLEEIKQKHIETISNLISIKNQKALFETIEAEIEHLKTLFDGCYLLGELSPRTSDAIVSYGEILSSKIISIAVKEKVEETIFKDSRELLKTNSNFGKATINYAETYSLISDYFNSVKQSVVLLPGFIASDEKGNTTTLGRGGSDFTASILANGCKATSLEIWTDVNGMFTANPKLVKQAKPIKSISYQEAMELSHFGAKVLYPPTIQPVLSANIPIWIKNTFNAEANGTLISKLNETNGNPVIGISHIEDIALLTLEGSGMIGVAGSSKRLFEVLSKENIN